MAFGMTLQKTITAITNIPTVSQPAYDKSISWVSDLGANAFGFIINLDTYIHTPISITARIQRVGNPAGNMYCAIYQRDEAPTAPPGATVLPGFNPAAPNAISLGNAYNTFSNVALSEVTFSVIGATPLTPTQHYVFFTGDAMGGGEDILVGGSSRSNMPNNLSILLLIGGGPVYSVQGPLSSNFFFELDEATPPGNYPKGMYCIGNRLYIYYIDSGTTRVLTVYNTSTDTKIYNVGEVSTDISGTSYSYAGGGIGVGTKREAGGDRSFNLLKHGTSGSPVHIEGHTAAGFSLLNDVCFDGHMMSGIRAGGGAPPNLNIYNPAMLVSADFRAVTAEHGRIDFCSFTGMGAQADIYGISYINGNYYIVNNATTFYLVHSIEGNCTVIGSVTPGQANLRTSTYLGGNRLAVLDSVDTLYIYRLGS
jgi:hypothetical protein